FNDHRSNSSFTSSCSLRSAKPCSLTRFLKNRQTFFNLFTFNHQQNNFRHPPLKPSSEALDYAQLSA
ncbi:hypothetical protein, partial [Variovorax sp.]|uniref:hypothetical protein n=1 Tax=Variovorax sp. TaxID=1871043 RepID=UPI004038017A